MLPEVLVRIHQIAIGWQLLSYTGAFRRVVLPVFVIASVILVVYVDNPLLPDSDHAVGGDWNSKIKVHQVPPHQGLFIP